MLRLYRRRRFRLSGLGTRHAPAVFGVETARGRPFVGGRAADRQLKRGHSCSSDRVRDRRGRCAGIAIFGALLRPPLGCRCAATADTAAAQRPQTHLPQRPPAPPGTPRAAAATARAAGARAATGPAASKPSRRRPRQPQLIYSPWTKFCLKEQSQRKQVCFTGKDARVESGMPVVSAALIEPEGEPKKLLRVTLPLAMKIQHGTRLSSIDQAQPHTGPYCIVLRQSAAWPTTRPTSTRSTS